MYRPKRTETTILLNLTDQEKNKLTNFRDKLQLTVHHKVGYSDAVLKAIEFASGGMFPNEK